jgi:hypothetical protein
MLDSSSCPQHAGVHRSNTSGRWTDDVRHILLSFH